MNETITQLIKGASVVAPDDTLNRAAKLVRASDGSSLIVIDRGQILGTINEKAIAAALSQADDYARALETPVQAFMDPGLTFVSANVTLREAAGVFAANDADMLPVIDSYGNYYGVIYRADLIGYMTHSLKMPPVAGMATPLGVYLTTGTVSGGAGSFGLFLTGVSLGLTLILSRAIAMGILHLFGYFTHIPISMYLNSPPIGAFNVWDIPYYASLALQLVMFGVLMRLSPLAGYHAAEHMTVHAIEAGDVLTSEIVRKMPRVHPRCGTNLLAGASLFLIVASNTSSDTAIMLAMVVVILGWRSVGGWMQYYITTHDPSAKQLANGVAAGNELVERYHERPNYQIGGFERIWKMGLLQNACGMTLTLGLLELLQRFVHMPWLIF